ncbi:hypothetical protein [Micromonospora sp. WMMC273]|uniref:hypothetical protein n=1 Tax=Micromonospora sp. WMMC273 TaxID=3015157 RepID=UPI0022B64DD5|nr:hypothetical protein [Micromonospora sp. WMMC273]MCZ7478902.1 hypothetical protein [Micromonospora sp. WMMC273]
MLLIAAELAHLGTAPEIRQRIAAQAATDFLDGMVEHSDDDLAGLTTEHKATAAMIALHLIAIERASGGASCPDMARPAAFAAWAVREATRYTR